MGSSPKLPFTSFVIALLFNLVSLIDVLAYPRASSLVEAEIGNVSSICLPPPSPFDYSAKTLALMNMPICQAEEDDSILVRRQTLTDDDYSCSETKPCSNGACCPKKTGYCNYGPDACGPDGINNQSPNDVCWSNCDATSECGQFAATPGAECPLNVCCSQYGFCGMTSDFCDKGKDPSSGCQSNCNQPGSGASGGDVQSRVIGYYESWQHDRSCIGMDFKDIPVGGLTHLHFAFGYITPGDFNVSPMDGNPQDLFSQLTALKERNSGLKAIIALGGWTFNDDGTATQPVYSQMVSSAATRAKFIDNLLSFLREYAFDGVDFDWEYPGAPDRGGHPDDGINFTKFLSELKDAISKEPVQYVVSFTAPTSYWYLRWFDLKAVDYVDWVNVMSYDLHGVWDSTDPIGSHVLAHTNLTEIKLAFDLFWRNKVPANKLNLGLGFYGRSFQLSDPSCYKPGCNFKGGASPGACTGNSGTLSYREITDIIDEHKLEPYYDKVDAAKYIVWNQDQWVSYDDADTFKQKVDFANNLGLGGLLIWSIDQDTADLKALQAVLAPKSLDKFAAAADDASYWQDATQADCYVTDCGGTCKSGFLPITHQPCGSATAVFRHSTEKDSVLCCPVTAAPDPNQCVWRGSPPSCNGHCQDGEVAVELNRWGDGDYCEDGNKAYCCKVPAGTENKCYWTGVGDDCNSGDELFTFAGTFLETIVDILSVFPPTLIGIALEDALAEFDMDLERKYCCPPDDAKKWQNCQWHGEPGSCFDNHCDIGHQVQLTESAYGLGLNCFPRLERQRVYCCDPTGGKSPFLPVPLSDLFENPPTGDNVDANFDLKVDDTWGTGVEKAQGNQPDDAAFGFVVLASPELQISLDKRDGSDWELFNCNDAVSEEEQTVQMVCTTNGSPSSNCNKIQLGHGVPGTILQMPKGCGPGKYAVAKTLIPSANQDLPNHLAKRKLPSPVVYDLTFDYNWMRVPRDLGDTQMRIDFSNEVGYWDSIVDKAAKRKAKRSLDDLGRNHRRWLEDEWRDDFHFGALSHDELHKRWFGEDVIAWLKGLFNPQITQEFTHNLDTTFTAKLIEQNWGPCDVHGANVQANLLVQALASVSVATSFGFTLITKLSLPLDLSQSYLFFKNKGDVSALFTLDALGKASFNKQFQITGLQNFPGATFGIPKLVTIGPNFVLNAEVDAEVTLAAHLESKVQIAKWDIQQTYPIPDADYDAKILASPNNEGTGSFDGISQPTFDLDVTAGGSLTAHLQPTFEFGIIFDPMWHVSSAKVDLVADGWIRFKGEAGGGTSGTCPFTYGIDVGADLYALAEAPATFGWSPQRFNLTSVAKSPKLGGTCPTLAQKRSNDFSPLSPYWVGGGNITEKVSEKRAAVVGPVLTLPQSCFFCPPGSSSGTSCDSITGWEPWQVNDPDLVSKRDLVGHENWHTFEKRAKKNINFCTPKMTVTSPPFDSSGDIISSMPGINTYGYTNPSDCNDFGFDLVTVPVKGVNSMDYATEHILEFQLLSIFITKTSTQLGNKFANPSTSSKGTNVNLCGYMKPYWYTPKNVIDINGVKRTALQWVSYQFPGSDNAFTSEFVLLDKYVNTAKEGMWGDDAINADGTMNSYEQSEPDRAVKNIKDVISAYKYHQIQEISANLLKQKNRVGNMFDQMDSLPSFPAPSGNQPYQKIGLKAAWDTWISGRAQLARSKAETYMRQWLESLQNGYASEYQRQIAEDNPDVQELIDKIDALAKEVDSTLKNRWNPPF